MKKCHVHGLEDLFNMRVMFPKQIYRFNVVSIEILLGFSAEVNKLIVKLIWKSKGPKITKIISKQEKEN